MRHTKDDDESAPGKVLVTPIVDECADRAENLAQAERGIALMVTVPCEERRVVWEEAAIYWDTMAEGPCRGGKILHGPAVWLLGAANEPKETP